MDLISSMGSNYRKVNFIMKIINAIQNVNNQNVIQGLVNFNQSQFAEFSFESSIRHKQLKELYQEFLTFSSINIEQKQILKEQVKEKIEELDKFTSEEFFAIFIGSFNNYLVRYFKDRSVILPRACIKLLDSDTGYISTLFRTTGDDLGDPYNPKLNTAFQIASEVGNPYFLSNNIPNDVKDGYKNARINNDRALNYKEPGIFNCYKNWKNKSKKSWVDRQWIGCWTDCDDELDHSFYKSTLVVPISIKISDLKHDLFKNKFHVFDNAYRILFGFLCFDHRDTGYFNKNFDLEIARTLADLLSLYYIVQLQYTSYSSTYQDARADILSS